MNKVELLAPAKDKSCAIAAIDYGADAVYIAAENFGARKLAKNSIEDIKEVVDYAHKFNVKVYVTLNTILNDDELNEAKNLIKKLEEICVDALIVQDLGLLSIETKIPFHASTQCDIRDLEKVKWLEQIGFERVVLARELSLEQIKNIKKKSNVELEVFIHGALCVCYSGQCYLSYAIGNRSANRGECAQPCRKKYTLIDDKGNIIFENKHLLSLRDFNASNHIKTLAEIGVKSFKIEGRLKDSNYVKNIVAYYRKLIDNLGLEKTSYGESEFDFEPNPAKSFNRGFTDYFLEKRKDCYNFDSVNSQGEFLGKVLSVGKNYFTINADISAQDGLWFEKTGCLVNKVEGNKIFPNKMPNLKVGDKVFRNRDSAFEKIVNSVTKRKIDAKIIFKKNKVEAMDEYNHYAEIEYDFEEYSNNVQSMKNNIEKAFKKSGDSIYKVISVKIETDDVPFLPVSKLNEIRRSLLNNLEQREFSYNKNMIKNVPYNKTLDYRANILNSYAKEFYKSCGCNIEEYALESGLTSCKGKCVMTTKHCLKFASGLCNKDINLFLIDEKNKKYSLKFNCQKCEMEIYY
jgi:putative protease